MKITIIFLAILLVGTITAGITLVSLSKDMTFDKELKDSLTDVGIGKFEVRNKTCIEYDENQICLKTDNTLLGYSQPVVSSCRVIDEYSCEFSIFQQGGINKNQIKVVTKYCLNYSEPTNMSEEIICINWKVLTDNEVALEVENKVEELLVSIAQINIERDKVKVETTRGEEYKIEIK